MAGTREGETQDAAAFARRLSGRHVVVVSPHFDDAALSVGGLLWRLRHHARITLLTVFARSAWAAPFSAIAGATAEAVSVKRALEERNYADALGAAVDMLALEDASLRGYDARSERAAPHDSGAWCHGVEATLSARLAALQVEVVIGPAAVGGHVDHVFVRDGLRRWCVETGIELLLYQDLPYATEPALWSAGPPGAEPIEALDIPIESELDAKLRNLRLYRSQIDARTCRPIVEHARRLGRGVAAERLWILSPIRPTDLMEA